MAGDALAIFHGGGPTAVINASLYGAVDEALSSRQIGRVLGVLGGVDGISQGRFVDFSEVPHEGLRGLLASPSSAIGSSRTPLEAEDYVQLARDIERAGIRWLLCTGGNGTQDTCGKIWRACQEADVEVDVVGIPKTMDNDISVTDHAPGFASAARFMAANVSAVCCDVHGLPAHVSVIEALGRNAGWVAAASAMADESGTGGPDLIYLPERDFDESAFLDDAQRLVDEKRSGVIVVSEGLHKAGGVPVAPPLFTTGRSTYFGDVSAYLAQLIISKLGCRARSEKPGLMQRASIAWQSEVDRDEAAACGREAVRAALDGDSGTMVGIERLSTCPYRTRLVRIPIERVMLEERHMPQEFINDAGNGVTEAYREWLKPLLGGPLPRYTSFIPR